MSTHLFVPLFLTSAILFFFLHDTVRPNNHQTDAFSSGMSLNSFLMDRAISLFIYSFSLRRSRPFKNTACFSSSALKLCAHTSAIPHMHAVSLYLKQSVLVQVVDLLFSTCCAVITFASAHGTGARRHVLGGSDSMKTTEYKAKQITKSLQDAGLHLYFCKHSNIKYK